MTPFDVVLVVACIIPLSSPSIPKPRLSSASCLCIGRVVLTTVYRRSEPSPIWLRRTVNSPGRSPPIRRLSPVPPREPQISPVLFSMAENGRTTAGECLREKGQWELEKPLTFDDLWLTPGRPPSMALTGLMDPFLLWLDPFRSHRRALRACAR
jgi:hypothetical protein